MEPPGNPLSLLIGKIVRHGAQLERSTRNVWLCLVGPSLVAHTHQGSITAYNSQCRTMLAHADIDDAKRAIAIDVLIAAAAAWDERNRAVHDIWIEEDEADSEFVRRRLRRRVAPNESADEVTILSLADIEKSIVDLRAAIVRLDFLESALRHDLPSWRSQNEPVSITDGETDWKVASENSGPFAYLKVRVSKHVPKAE